MSTLAEIEAAAEALPREQQEKLIRFLTERTRLAESQTGRARLIQRGDDLLLEAPPGAPPMTPENVKRILGCVECM
jgi:hypothetical protein